MFKIDMIITKSISRFAGNTPDCLKYIRQLKDKSIPVFFEKEQDLEDAVIKALNELLSHREGYQNQLAQNIATIIRASAAITTDGIDEKLMELQQELVKKANNKEAYDEIADEIFALREKRQQASMDTVQRDEQLQRITELQDFIKDQSSDLTVFDEALVKRWLKQIIIWPTHCTVEFKSGLKVDVERYA